MVLTDADILTVSCVGSQHAVYCTYITLAPLLLSCIALLQLYKLQSALRQAKVKMYGGERASHDLSLERAPSDRCV